MDCNFLKGKNLLFNFKISIEWKIEILTYLEHNFILNFFAVAYYSIPDLIKMNKYKNTVHNTFSFLHGIYFQDDDFMKFFKR